MNLEFQAGANLLLPWNHPLPFKYLQACDSLFEAKLSHPKG